MLAFLLACSLCFIVLARSVSLIRFWCTRYLRKQHDTPDRAAPRLSKDTGLIRPEYDVVVIGSGYGGGVAASRMARAGKSVCVLERGAESWSGEYPHTLQRALQEYRINDKRRGRSSGIGRVDGLYQTVKGAGQDVFLGCGLGGTSLINAGVYLRADERVFKGKEWPAEIREHTDDLSQFYERGERMFQPRSYPKTFPTPRKLSVLEDQAHHLGLSNRLYRPPLTTSFEDGLNNAGAKMCESTGSGNECTGINDGSKNSVLTTYLADAWNWGTDIFCGVEVSHIQTLGEGEGYLVHYALLDGRQVRSPMLWVRAKELVCLGAGALGTTELLLRSKLFGLSTSPLLGQKLSGNGDLLAFAYDCDRSVDAVGHELFQSERCGPCITGCIDLRGKQDAPNVRDGYVIQDGAVPEALGPVVQALIESRMIMDWPLVKQSIQKLIAKPKRWIYGPYNPKGSINRTAVYLVMSHDESEGTMETKDSQIILRWSDTGVEYRSRTIQDVLYKATASIGGTLVSAPCITVHPLGGACMSRDNTGFGGVVNHMGRLYCGSGEKTHEGIICVDASIIPTSLGVNPCATITALAERSCATIVRDRDWVSNERSNEPLDLEGSPYRSLPLLPSLRTKMEQLRLSHLLEGLRFDETMTGFLQAADCDCSFQKATESARAASNSAQLSMTVRLYRPGPGSYRGSATGTLSYAALSQHPLLITEGSVSFFTVDEDVSDAVNLVYDMELLSTEGMEYTLHGYKRIDSSIAFSALKTWRATTTLCTTIRRRNGTLAAKGMLHVSARNLLEEMLSFRCSGDATLLQRFWHQAQFLAFFARNVVSYTLSPLRSLQYHGPVGFHVGENKKPTPTKSWVQSDDGVRFCIKKWEPSPQVPSKETPIVLIPGASVDDRIFFLQTIPTNTIDYFTSQGYRCYVPILRFGIGDEAKNGWTVFDARLDVKAALQYVRDHEDNKKLYAIVHCLGSIAMATALLNGDVDASWLCGMTCSQVFTDLMYSRDNYFKARYQVLIRAYKALAGSWFSCSTSPSTSWFHYLLDQALRFYPVGSRLEMCNSAACHRCDVPFGRCWNHANLNHATHARLGELFDGIHLNFLTHLSRMGAIPPHHVRTDLPEFKDLVNPDNLQRLADLRICFLSSGDNAVWQPDATKKSYDMLQQACPDGAYDRVVVQDYGHLDCWMGKYAYRQVYPRVMHHIRSCTQVLDERMCDTLDVPPEEDGYVSITV